jgi:MATE family multidrug resistance protein
MIPGVPMYYTFEALKRYLQAQGLVMPILWVSLFVCFFNAVITYVVMFLVGLGFHGAPISLSITYTTMMCSAIVCIYWLTDWRKTWGGWSKESLRGWAEFFALGVPGVLMVCAEWWGYEIHTILAGWIDTVSLAAQTVLLTTIAILYMLPLGFSIGATTRVGNELGAGNGNSAARAAKVAISFVVCTQLCFSVVLFSLRTKWGFIFSNDSAVTELVANTLPILCLFLFADGGQGVASGVLRGSGKQQLGAIFNLFGYYALSVPIGAFLAFYVKIGIKGLWIGLLFGALFCFFSFIVVLLRLDWQREAELARKRSEAEAKEISLSESSSVVKMEEVQLVKIAANEYKDKDSKHGLNRNHIETTTETENDAQRSPSTLLLPVFKSEANDPNVPR